MITERVKCTECDRQILPSTALANDGLCGQCIKIPEWLRREGQEFDRQLASGALFTPSQSELETAKQPEEFGNNKTIWYLEPEYYEYKLSSSSIEDEIAHAASQTDGFVFLITDRESRLNLSFNQIYGVCEYWDEDSQDNLYAYTANNLREQVTKELHLVQACPYDGVGMLWLPSRFHMPRQQAFEIVSSLISNNIPSNVIWLDSGDISRTDPGHG
jgi:hypothetical protein